MAIATLTSKGQVTIPKQVRESLCLHDGEKVQFLLNGAGEAILKPINRTVDDVFGRLQRPKDRAHSVSEMKAAIGKRLRKSQP